MINSVSVTLFHGHEYLFYVVPMYTFVLYRVMYAEYDPTHVYPFIHLHV